MSNIKIASLGGLNENGKNLYTVNVDDQIVIFDVGLKYATDKMYGIDYVIPEFSYLVENKDKIVGVFISHAHYENMGALIELVKTIPNINIYVTKFTSKIIEIESKEENIVIKNLHIIYPHKKINFKNFSVFPFSVTHSVPESVGFSVNTKDGSVVYMSDFVIDPTMKGYFDMDIGKLAYIGKQGVLALMCESVFSEKKGFTTPNHKLHDFFVNVIDKYEHRIIISLLPIHIHLMQEIFDALEGKNRKVVVMSKKLQMIVNMSIKEKYLTPSPNLIGDLTNLKDDNSIVLVSNEREMPFYNLNRIVKGYDKFVTLNKDDTVVFADPSYDAYELTMVKLKNEIALKGSNIISIPKDKCVRLHASSEDIMLIIRLFNPKYYIPIKGEYRYQVENANLAYNVGIPKENILLKENGDIINIVDGKLVETFDRIKVEDILIDGKSINDIGELVLKDREMLSSNGLVLITATMDKKNKKIIIGPEVVTRGFIYPRDNMDIMDEIKQKSLEIIKRNSYEKYADYSKIRTEIREEIGSILYKKTESKPVILTVIQEM